MVHVEDYTQTHKNSSPVSSTMTTANESKESPVTPNEAKESSPGESSRVRSVEEIVERLQGIRLGEEEDFFGVIFSDLLSYLPFTLAKEWLKDEVT